MPLAETLEEALGEIAADAAALACEGEVLRCRDILRAGTSADRQLALYHSLLPTREPALG